jgi:hypothetical protein
MLAVLVDRAIFSSEDSAYVRVIFKNSPEWAEVEAYIRAFKEWERRSPRRKS